MPNPLIYLSSSRKQTARKSHSLSHTQPTCRVDYWPLSLSMPQKGATPQKTPLTHCPVTRHLSVKGGLASVALCKEKLAHTTYLRFSSSQTFRKSYSLPFTKMPNKGDTLNLFSHKMNR